MNQKNPIIKDFIKINPKSKFIKTSYKIRDLKKGKVILEKRSGALLLDKYSLEKDYYKKQLPEISTPDKFCKSHLEFFLKKNKFNNICDFGCGYAKYLNVFKKYSKNFYGIEINKKKQLFLKKRKINFETNLLNFNINFDLISFIFSFNHLPNQLEILNSVRTKLNKNGKIFMILINASDLIFQKNINQDYQDFRISKEFLVLHSSKSIEAFLKKAKFKNIKIFHKQRYEIDNLFKWLFLKEKNLYNQIKRTDFKEINSIYKTYLEKNKCSDTLLVQASV
jgi:SAM-dependent methyltransferase